MWRVVFGSPGWPLVTAIHRSFWHACGTPMRRIGQGVQLECDLLMS
jgi:hypothetical protein